MANLESRDGRPPSPPRLQPTWTTWMWLSFAVLVAVLTVIGLFYATNVS